jgi:hypothetical protein
MEHVFVFLSLNCGWLSFRNSAVVLLLPLLVTIGNCTQKLADLAE